MQSNLENEGWASPKSMSPRSLSSISVWISEHLCKSGPPPPCDQQVHIVGHRENAESTRPARAGAPGQPHARELKQNEGSFHWCWVDEISLQIYGILILKLEITWNKKN